MDELMAIVSSRVESKPQDEDSADWVQDNYRSFFTLAAGAISTQAEIAATKGHLQIFKDLEALYSADGFSRSIYRTCCSCGTPEIIDYIFEATPTLKKELITELFSQRKLEDCARHLEHASLDEKIQLMFRFCRKTHDNRFIIDHAVIELCSKIFKDISEKDFLASLLHPYKNTKDKKSAELEQRLLVALKCFPDITPASHKMYCRFDSTWAKYGVEMHNQGVDPMTLPAFKKRVERANSQTPKINNSAFLYSSSANTFFPAVDAQLFIREHVRTNPSAKEQFIREFSSHLYGTPEKIAQAWITRIQVLSETAPIKAKLMFQICKNEFFDGYVKMFDISDCRVCSDFGQKIKCTDVQGLSDILNDVLRDDFTERTLNKIRTFASASQPEAEFGGTDVKLYDVLLQAFQHFGTLVSIRDITEINECPNLTRMLNLKILTPEILADKDREASAKSKASLHKRI